MEMKGPRRRSFLKQLAASAAALPFAMDRVEAARLGWTKQVGLELYTVRDLTPKDFEGTVAKVAGIGYKEVEPASQSYGGLEPKEFRALLDRYGLTMPSTHIGAQDGPDLEQQLEGFQTMGIRYTEVRPVRESTPSRTQRRGAPPPVTEESVKRTAEELNRHGRIVAKFGMKMLYHNHAPEFQPFEGSSLRPYDILLSGTDPSLVAMQLDIGWASVAGQDVIGMFHKNPGRFELWHVKDARGIHNLPASLNQRERMREITLVPVGQGEVDYRAIFAQAELAGLKHFCIEQDNAAAWGDSMAAAKVSYQALVKLLS